MSLPQPSERINLLARKWQEGTITDSEREEFERWYADFEDVLQVDSGESELAAENRLYNVISRRGNIRPKPQRNRSWIAVAASVLIFMSIGGYFYFHESAGQHLAELKLNDVKPGGNKAVLTLASGEQIILTSAKDGHLAVQGNSEISKTADGSIAYHQNGGPSASSAYNMVNTPVGGQYHLILSDGTNVWLNAASSIKFPAVFTGTERKVELTGEAYFEVAHNAAKPFRVKSNHQVVEVLGTHFNLNSYPDDTGTITTLLEGSVKVTASSGSKLIKPGQQSVLKGTHLNVAPADVEEAVAWKNGYFKFNEDLETIMGKVARWYNMSVVYQSRPDASYTFEGEISRQRNLSEILTMMEYTGKVHFTIEGRRIIVTR